MKLNNYSKLVIAILISGLAGAIGSFFTSPSIPNWYAALAKPEFSPPNWVFGPVWTVLYIMMGVAAFLVWKRGLDQRGVKFALGLFILQLALNTLWSIVFFGWHNLGAAVVEIALLWLAIIATMIAFWRISRPAAILLAPYVIWVSFASCLTYAIWSLN